MTNKKSTTLLINMSSQILQLFLIIISISLIGCLIFNTFNPDLKWLFSSHNFQQVILFTVKIFGFSFCYIVFQMLINTRCFHGSKPLKNKKHFFQTVFTWTLKSIIAFTIVMLPIYLLLSLFYLIFSANFYSLSEHVHWLNLSLGVFSLAIVINTIKFIFREHQQKSLIMKNYEQ